MLALDMLLVRDWAGIKARFLSDKCFAVGGGGAGVGVGVEE